MRKRNWMNGAILCVGEVLWDSMPTGLYLGGAPFNVACHLHRLQQRSTLVSRVGDDVLGREAVRRIEAFGLATDLVQIDPRLPTGLVRVHVDGGGIPDYEIVEPAAWDAIALDEASRPGVSIRRLRGHATRRYSRLRGGRARRHPCTLTFSYLNTVLMPTDFRVIS